MKNAYQDGRVLDVTLAGAVVSGQVVTQGHLLGIAVTHGAPGDTIAVRVEGVYRLPKLGTAVIATGDPVHWDINPGRVVVTGTATGDVENFGYAVESAGSGTTEVHVRLCPGMGVPKSA